MYHLPFVSSAIRMIRIPSWVCSFTGRQSARRGADLVAGRRRPVRRTAAGLSAPEVESCGTASFPLRRSEMVPIRRMCRRSGRSSLAVCQQKLDRRSTPTMAAPIRSSETVLIRIICIPYFISSVFLVLKSTRLIKVTLI